MRSLILAARGFVLDARCPVRALCFCLFLLFGWVTPTSAASPENEASHRLELSWQAPAECPGSEVFVEEVAALTTSIEWVRGEGSAKKVEVVLVPGEGRGALVMLDGGKEMLSRDVAEKDCGVMVRGLAFVLAVLLDPSVKLEEAPDAEAEPEIDAAEVPPEETKNPTPALSAEPQDEVRNAHSPPPELVPRPSASPSPRREPAKTVPTADDSRRPRVVALPVFSVFVGGSLESGLNTRPAFGGAASVQARFHRVDPGDRTLKSTRVFSPSFRMGGQFASSPASQSGANLEVLRYGGLLQLCPVWIPTAPRLRMSPCLSGELGIVRAKGSGVDHSTPASRPWGALAALARLEVPLGRFQVGISAGPRLHITRYGYSINSEAPDEPSEDLYEIPRFSAVFELSIGQRVF